MSWRERLLVPAFTSPVTQTRTEWKYRDAMTTEFVKRIDSRKYVGLDGTYHIDLGFDGEDHPMVCIFDGQDHDLDATDFIRTLRESAKDNPGVLDHPTEGRSIDVVVQFVRKARDTVEDATETLVEVVFLEQTLPPEIKQDSPVTSAKRQFNALSESASTDFDAAAFLDTVNGKLAAVKSATSNLNVISSTVSGVVRGISQATTTINLIKDDITRNLDTIIKTPAILADQLQNLIGTITSIPGDLNKRINGWQNLYSLSRPNDGEFLSPTGANMNVIANKALTCTACVGNMLLDVSDNADGFDNIVDALTTFSEVQGYRSDLESFLAEQESVYKDNILQDQYVSLRDSLDQMAQLSKLAGESVRNAIPNLGAQVTIELSKDYSILQLAYELYGNVDDETLEKIINTNALTTAEIVLLPRGKELIV